jgi:hypothetical protein
MLMERLMMLPGMMLMLLASMLIEVLGRSAWHAPAGRPYLNLLNHGPDFQFRTLAGLLPPACGLLLVAGWMAGGFAAGLLGARLVDGVDRWIVGMAPPVLFALIFSLRTPGPTLLGVAAALLTIAAAWSGTRLGIGREAKGRQ